MNADFDLTGPGDPGHVGAVLDEVTAFIDRFMSVTSAQLDAIALWIAHTHAADQFDVVAYMFITSAEKRCGKSLLLDLLERLVLRGRSTANISPAALYRLLEAQHPTLLFDEVDNIFVKGKTADPGKAELAGLVNAGFQRGRVAYRMGGANMRQLEEFDAFGPKALAGIGGCLPDTTQDRSIPIELERKPRTVTKERYRIRIHEEPARRLGERLGAAVQAVDGLGDAWPSLPDELNDRQQDIWEPLLAIADAAGADWPKRAREAAKALHKGQQGTESLGTQLLGDVRQVFTKPQMLTKHIVTALCELDEAPWGDWRGGQGITSAQFVRMLAPYGLRSKHLRIEDGRGRGFDRDQFDPVFERYLDVIGGPVVVSVDSDDTDTEPQVAPVNSRETESVDTNVDAPEQAESGLVNGVNTSNDDWPAWDNLAEVAR